MTKEKEQLRKRELLKINSVVELYLNDLSKDLKNPFYKKEMQTIQDLKVKLLKMINQA